MQKSTLTGRRAHQLTRLLSYQRRELKFDNYDAVLEHLGAVGKYQIYFALWLQLAAILYGSQMKFMIFAGLNQEIVPCDSNGSNPVNSTCSSCSNLSNSSKNQQKPHHLKQYGDRRTFFMETDYRSAFKLEKMKAAAKIATNMEQWKNASLEICHAHRYPFHSIAMEWNLTGTRQAIIPTIITLQMIGVFIGPIIFGPLADSFGRRRICIFLLTSLTIVGISSAFSPSWPWLAGFRLGIGVLAGGLLPISFVYISEVLVSNSRILFTSLQWPINYLIFALLGYLSKDWRTLSWSINIFAIAPIIMLVFYLYESPKWLLARGRKREAREVMVKMAYRNGVSPSVVIGLNERDDSSDDEGDLKDNRTKTVVTHNYRLKYLFNGWRTSARTFALIYSHLVTATVTYGFIFNMSNLAGNPFVNCAIVGLIEVVLTVSAIIPDVALKSCGRRLMHQVGLWLPLIMSISMAILQAVHAHHDVAYATAIQILGIIGTASNVYAWLGIMPMAVEIFPTNVRSSGTALCQVGARLGGILASKILTLYAVYEPTPFIVFAVLLFLNILISACVLPETKNTPLPEIPADHASINYS